MNTNESQHQTVLIVDDNPNNLGLLVDCLTDAEFEILVARDGETAIERAQQVHPDIVLLDVLMPPGIDGFETCRRIKKDMPDMPVIFMTALTETEDKVKGFDIGAVDYITKPIQPEEVLARVNAHLTIRNLQQKLKNQNADLKQAEENLKAVNETLEHKVADRTIELQNALSEVEHLKDRLQEENIYLQEEIKGQHNFEAMVGQSETLRQVLHQVEQVAETDATVLVLGETGTGKELIARAVHDLSNRKERPLVKVNCAALPANLIESELFGHEKGAFTGAQDKKIGRFELADGGTIFLDEIGDLPLELQAKLLRVLQEGELERLGNATSIKVDVRVIAATNRDLESAAAKGEFREDLFYRLNVFPVRIPPLRERKGDIPMLVTHFVQKYSVKIGKQIHSIPQQTLEALEAYTWPGNVRELENVIERAMILSRGNRLELGDWHPRTGTTNGGGFVTLEEHERVYIQEVLETTDGRLRGDNGAAKILGMKPTTLASRMLKLGIRRKE